MDFVGGVEAWGRAEGESCWRWGRKRVWGETTIFEGL